MASVWPTATGCHCSYSETGLVGENFIQQVAQLTNSSNTHGQSSYDNIFKFDGPLKERPRLRLSMGKNQGGKWRMPAHELGSVG